MNIFQWNFIWNSKVFIHENIKEHVVTNMAVSLSGPQCVEVTKNNVSWTRTNTKIIISIVDTLILCYQVSSALSCMHDMQTIPINHLYMAWAVPVELNIISLQDICIKCCLWLKWLFQSKDQLSGYRDSCHLHIKRAPTRKTKDCQCDSFVVTDGTVSSIPYSRYVDQSTHNILSFYLLRECNFLLFYEYLLHTIWMICCNTS